MGTVTDIAAASMNMRAMQLQTACSTALLKKSMEGMEQQAASLINDMMQATVTIPATSVGHLDVYV